MVERLHPDVYGAARRCGQSGGCVAHSTGPLPRSCVVRVPAYMHFAAPARQTRHITRSASLCALCARARPPGNSQSEEVHCRLPACAPVNTQYMASAVLQSCGPTSPAAVGRSALAMNSQTRHGRALRPHRPPRHRRLQSAAGGGSRPAESGGGSIASGGGKIGGSATAGGGSTGSTRHASISMAIRAS